jgi:hypothetical protein
MKAIFKNMILAYKGKCDGLVYYYNPRLNRMIVRPHVKPRPSAQTAVFSSISSNLKALAPSPGYVNDLRVYVELHNRKASNHRRPLLNWCNAYNKLMYALARSYYLDGFKIPDPEPVPPEHSRIDLATLTRDDIYDASLPCLTVKRAVEAGLLQSVTGYELMTQLM